MFTRLIRLAFAAFVFFICGLAAADINVPLVNPTGMDNFDGGLSPMPGWQLDLNGNSNSPQGRYGMVARGTGLAIDAAIGTNGFIWSYCFAVCPSGSYNAMSQQVDGLVSGAHYQVSFWAAALGTITPGQEVYFPSKVGPIKVGLGSQLVTAPVVPVNGYPLVQRTWVQETLDFIYKDKGSSALLKIFSYFGDELPCVPCTNQYMYFANFKMTQLSSPPTLQVQEAMGGNRVADSDQFTAQITQNGTTIVNATTNSTTSGAGSTVTAGTGTTGLTTLVTGTSYTITEAASGTTKLPQYSSTLACTDATGANKALSLNTPFTLADGDAISCTLTNTPKAPTVRLTKALGTAGRINNADQFTVLVGQRLTTLASATTTGIGGVVNTGSTAWTNLVAGTSYSLSEVMTATSVSSLGQYSAVLSCSNAWAGSPTTVPSAAPVAFTPTYGDVLDCTWTNKPAFASLTITQRAIVTAPATFNPPETFVYTGNNGWTSQSNSSSKVNTATTGATQNLAALNVATTLTVAVPTVERGWRIASIQCTDTNAAVSKNPSPPTVLASSTSNMVTIPANYVVNNAKLQCAVFASRQI